MPLLGALIGMYVHLIPCKCSYRIDGGMWEMMNVAGEDEKGEGRRHYRTGVVPAGYLSARSQSGF